MDISNLSIGYSFNLDQKSLTAISSDLTFLNRDCKFYTVQLNILGGFEINEFQDLCLFLEHSRNSDLVFRYIEAPHENGKHGLIVLFDTAVGSDKIFGFKHMYNIRGYLNLFINSHNSIVVRNSDSSKIAFQTTFNNFPAGRSFYVYLSCLIFTLKNYTFDTELELKTTFEKFRALFIK
jgi:hypothetical protein